MQIIMLGPHWSKRLDPDLHCAHKCVSEHYIIYGTVPDFSLSSVFSLVFLMHGIILNVYCLVMKLSQAFRRFKSISIFSF
jgi:hypothetical protein